uniref:Uncharacterized protein n=1 Tax=Knipowitschia caucasica TaxID=637954 RepID=A0AAV2K272_KNICA
MPFFLPGRTTAVSGGRWWRSEQGGGVQGGWTGRAKPQTVRLQTRSTVRTVACLHKRLPPVANISTPKVAEPGRRFGIGPNARSRQDL